MERPYYGYNLVRYMPLVVIGIGVICITLAIFSASIWISVLLGILGGMLVSFAVFFQLVMGQCISHSKLNIFYDHFLCELGKLWDGKGKVLDIGTGQGPIAINIAKRFPQAQVYGVDTWTKLWRFFGMSKEGAIKNARIEEVHERCTFQHGNALNLPFKDGEFQVVVSVAAFHEIRIPDKMVLLKEAVRVLAPGGILMICDALGGPFLSTYKAKDMDDLCRKVEALDVKDVKHKPLKEALKKAGHNFGGLYNILEFKKEASPYHESKHWQEGIQLAYLSGRKA